MFLVLWEFEVKPGCEESFQNAYSPTGSWARLFQRDPHYRQTLLLRDPFRPRIYLTLDYWDSETAYQSFKALHRNSYDAMDLSCDDLTIHEQYLGSFVQSDPSAPAS